MSSIRIFDFRKTGRLHTSLQTPIIVQMSYFLKECRRVTEYPLLSPDLTPLDFCMWGCLKSKVCVNIPNNLEELHQRICPEMKQISPVIFERSPAQKCLQAFRSMPSGWWRTIRTFALNFVWLFEVNIKWFFLSFDKVQFFYVLFKKLTTLTSSNR